MEETLRQHTWTDPRSGTRHAYWTKRAPDGEGRTGRTFYSFDRETWHRSFKDAAVPVLKTETCVFRGEDGRTEEWRLFVDGSLTAPTFNSKGAADAYGDLIRAGLRRPEWSRTAERTHA